MSPRKWTFKSEIWFPWIVTVWSKDVFVVFLVKENLWIENFLVLHPYMKAENKETWAWTHLEAWLRAWNHGKSPTEKSQTNRWSIRQYLSPGTSGILALDSVFSCSVQTSQHLHKSRRCTWRSKTPTFCLADVPNSQSGCLETLKLNHKCGLCFLAATECLQVRME